jgi:hypothetical protein
MPLKPFEKVEGGKEGWVSMSAILSMTDNDPKWIKRGLWLMRNTGLLQCRRTDKELEFRLSKFAMVMGISWKDVKIKED